MAICAWFSTATEATTPFRNQCAGWRPPSTRTFQVEQVEFSAVCPGISSCPTGRWRHRRRKQTSRGCLRAVFWGGQTLEAFFETLRKVFPSLATPLPPESTTSTSMTYDSVTKLLTISAPIESEFHPTRMLLMRDCYWPIVYELMNRSAVVVLGDPGTGKSSLLRVVYELFVHGWTTALQEAAVHMCEKMSSHTHAKPFAKYKGVFWIMESGQFHYAARQEGTESVVQVEGVYGRNDEYQDVWRHSSVLLLVDGSVRTAFLAKISSVFVFASPQPANYQRMMKASKAVRLTLPTWSEAELLDLLKDSNENTFAPATAEVRVNSPKMLVWGCMLPYFEDMRSRAFGDLAVGVTDSNVPSHRIGGCGISGPDLAPARAGTCDEDTKPAAASPRFQSLPPDGTKLTRSTVSTSSNDTYSVVAQVASDTWEYDELAEFRRMVKPTDASTKDHPTDAAWSFLKAHILKRYKLVGGRIHLLLNPAETFETLKWLITSASEVD